MNTDHEFPAVSVITPAYNAAATIDETIASVKAQTFGGWEHVIVNDESTDDTADIVQRHASDPRVRLVPAGRRLGYCGARNMAAHLARGRYLAFLDADDLWLPRKMELQLRFHDRHPWCRVSHTAFEIFWDRGPVHRRGPLAWLDSLHRRRGWLLPVLYVRNVIAIQTLMMERDLFVRLGGFDETILGCEDRELWIRVAEAGERFGYVPRVLARYRLLATASSFVPQKLEQTWWELHQRKIVANPRVPPRIRREAAAFFYAYFGHERLKEKEYRSAREYFSRAIRSNPFGLGAAASVSLWLRSHLAELAQR